MYIDLGYLEFGPHPGKLLDSVGSDLADLVRVLKPTKSEDGKLSDADFSFTKRQKHWHVHAYFREPVEKNVRENALEVLRSVQFTEPKPAGFPVGKWNAEFVNGVKQVCEVNKDGTASVVETKRNSAGKAEVKDGSVVIVFEDDRTERWTPVGERMVVEYWYPSDQYPSGPAVLGIAELAK